MCPRLGGKTPSATVASSIYVDIKKYGDKSNFINHGKCYFSFRSVEIQADENQESLNLINKNDSVELKLENTLLDFIEEILDEYGNRYPMHYSDIANKIPRKNWSSKQGAISGTIIKIELMKDIVVTNYNGNSGRFFTTGNGNFGLLKWSKFDLNILIDSNNDEVKQEFRAQLMSLEPDQFEKLVGNLYSKMGFEIIYAEPNKPDGGIDIRAIPNRGKSIHANKKAIQAKRWSKNVQSPTVQQVRGSITAHEDGVIVTTSDFSPGARKDAESSGLKRIELINGDELIKRLIEYKIGVRKEKLEFYRLTGLLD